MVGDGRQVSNTDGSQVADFHSRYILKLFRDYVFHSIGVDGSPVLDLSHVLTSLNKVSSCYLGLSEI